jgi:sugar-specific transcriptional regulator TrmB
MSRHNTCSCGGKITLGEDVTLRKDTEEYVDVLVDLGLSRAQARSYLTLLEIGTASAKEIAYASKIARPDTYRAVADLLELGLTEKIVSVPARFRPLPIKEAVEALLLKRAKENLKLSKRANRLVVDLQHKPLTKQPSENNQMILLPCGETFYLKLRKALEKTSHSVCAIIPRKLAAIYLNKNLEVAEKALSRNVAVRLLTDSPTESELTEICDLQANPLFQIQYTACPPDVCFLILDGKETLLPKISSAGRSKASVIWSNNSCITKLAKTYFDAIWDGARSS